MKRKYKTGARDEASRSSSPQLLANVYVQDVVKGPLWLRRNKIPFFFFYFFPTCGVLVRGWGEGNGGGSVGGCEGF